MKYFRAVKSKAIYDRKYHVFCYITNNYLTIFLNLVYLDFILTWLSEKYKMDGFLPV